MTHRHTAAVTFSCVLASSLACNASGIATPTPSSITPTLAPSPTPIAEVVPVTTAPVIALDEFAKLVEDALISEDPEGIGSVMGSAFGVSYVDATGGFIATEDALHLLQNELLAAPTPITFDDSAEASSIWDELPNPPGITVVQALFSRGWGIDGKDQALVLIAASEDGSYYFAGVIYARGGFVNAPKLPTPTAGAASATSTAIAQPRTSPASHGPSLYTSDFRSGWASIDDLQVTSSQMGDGYLLSIQGPWAGWTYTTRLAQDQFYAEIVARPTECPSGQGTYGLIFHYVNETNFRTFVVWCSGLFSAFQRTDANRAALLQEGVLPLGLDISVGEHRIGVLSHNNTLNFFVDDYEVGQIGVSELPEGDIGPYVESAGAATTSVLFTALTVYSP